MLHFLALYGSSLMFLTLLVGVAVFFESQIP